MARKEFKKEFKNSQFDEKNGRMRRKRVSPLKIGKIEYVDYKDTDLLNKFLSERSKIKARYNSGNDAQQQRAVARAIKNAREMALMPYIADVTTQRRERRDENDRSDRASGPPPKPTTPPPATEGDDFESLESSSVEANSESSSVEANSESSSVEANSESSSVEANSESSPVEASSESVESFTDTQDNQDQVVFEIDEKEEL
jgi:small subunit ribosomal protein S18